MVCVSAFQHWLPLNIVCLPSCYFVFCNLSTFIQLKMNDSSHKTDSWLSAAKGLWKLNETPGQDFCPTASHNNCAFTLKQLLLNYVQSRNIHQHFMMASGAKSVSFTIQTPHPHPQPHPHPVAAPPIAFWWPVQSTAARKNHLDCIGHCLNCCGPHTLNFLLLFIFRFILAVCFALFWRVSLYFLFFFGILLFIAPSGRVGGRCRINHIASTSFSRPLTLESNGEYVKRLGTTSKSKNKRKLNVIEFIYGFVCSFFIYVCVIYINYTFFFILAAIHLRAENCQECRRLVNKYFMYFTGSYPAVAARAVYGHREFFTVQLLCFN